MKAFKCSIESDRLIQVPLIVLRQDKYFIRPDTYYLDV